MESGRISKRKEVPFSQVSNQALRDKTLSLRAKGLYALIQSYITIPNFVLYKQTLINMSIEGKDAFESAWKELKNRGYLVQIRGKNSEGKFIYEYELLDFIEEKELKEKPHTEKPYTEKPSTVKPPHGKTGVYNKIGFNNTDFNNKYKNKKQNPSANAPKNQEPKNQNPTTYKNVGTQEEDKILKEVNKGLLELKAFGYNTFNGKLVKDIGSQKTVSDVKNFVKRVINGELYYPNPQKKKA